jgi:hypothetical protein
MGDVKMKFSTIKGKKRKQGNSIFFLLIFLFLSVHYINAGTNDETNLIFNWAFMYKNVVPESEIKFLQDGTTWNLSYGQYQFFLQPEKNAFIYAFCYNPDERKLSILFPENFDFFREEYTQTYFYYVPGNGNEWIVINKEISSLIFYLIVSSNRLYDLEKAVEELQHSSLDKKNYAQNKLLEKIKYLLLSQKENDNCELPAPFAGTIRDDFQPIKKTVVSAKNYYGKTIILKFHK